MFSETTTEPPVQAVQDLIDALAAGGLDNILGPSKRTSDSAKNMIQKKFGSFVGKTIPPKQGMFVQKCLTL